MSMLDLLGDRRAWERFYEYKTSLVCPEELKRKLRNYIDGECWLPVVDAIKRGGAFPLPKKTVISKMSTQKKRTVFTYPERENTVLKLLTYLLLRRYDGIFAPVLFSFRPGRTAKDALVSLLRTPGVTRMYSYKVDVSDYFNSIPVERLLPMLREVTADDKPLYGFLSRLLSEPDALENGRPVRVKKGIMAGTPLASFYANLYLSGLDRLFFEAGEPRKIQVRPDGGGGPRPRRRRAPLPQRMRAQRESLEGGVPKPRGGFHVPRLHMPRRHGRRCAGFRQKDQGEDAKESPRPRPMARPKRS